MVAFNINTVFGQNTFKAVIKDSETKEPLIGATAVLEKTTKGAIADVTGMLIIENIPDGKQLIVFSYVGYETRKDTFDFPLSSTEAVEILLMSSEEELEEKLSLLQSDSGVQLQNREKKIMELIN